MNESAAAARTSARTVFIVAAVLMTVLLAVAGAGLAGGIAYAITHHGDRRVAGVISAVGSVMFGLFAVMPYLIAQLLARYVEYRINTDRSR